MLHFLFWELCKSFTLTFLLFHCLSSLLAPIILFLCILLSSFYNVGKTFQVFGFIMRWIYEDRFLFVHLRCSPTFCYPFSFQIYRHSYNYHFLSLYSRKIAVLGAGLMGAGIAQVSVDKNIHVSNGKKKRSCINFSYSVPFKDLLRKTTKRCLAIIIAATRSFKKGWNIVS